jgi:hypothetical protein
MVAGIRLLKCIHACGIMVVQLLGGDNGGEKGGAYLRAPWIYRISGFLASAMVPGGTGTYLEHPSKCLNLDISMVRINFQPIRRSYKTFLRLERHSNIHSHIFYNVLRVVE